MQVADADEGLSCEVTATNGAGHESATSNTLQVPAPLGPLGESPGPGPGTDPGPPTHTGTVSNAFELVGLEGVMVHGTIRLTLRFPGAGAVQIVGEASVA